MTSQTSSGATLFEHSLKSDPLGLLSKMLLESKRWWNPCRTFRWSSKTVIAEKQAVSHDVSADLESLTESLTSSDYKDIPSVYSIYRLVPSARRTKGNGSGSSGILPTPCTTDWKTPLTEEQAKRYAEKHPNASCLNQLRAGIIGSTPDTQGKQGKRNGFKQHENRAAKQMQYRGGSSEDGGFWRSEDFWRDFPSESPVLRGNDGFPLEVDSLTIPFSRWRREAIKAYGNALVPQVLYQFYDTINKIENGNSI